MKNPTKILLRIPVPWVFIIAYLIGIALQYIFPLNIYSHVSIYPLKIIGGLLLILGAIIAAWSLIIFRRARTTTTPGENSKEIITYGPYRLSRNPMYISIIIFYIGEAFLLLHSWPLFTLVLMLLYINYVVIPLEEETLRKDFKDKYESYCKLTRRWI